MTQMISELKGPANSDFKFFSEFRRLKTLCVLRVRLETGRVGWRSH